MEARGVVGLAAATGLAMGLAAGVAGLAGATAAGLASAGFGAATAGLAVEGEVAGVWAINRLTGKRVNKIRIRLQASD